MVRTCPDVFLKHIRLLPRKTPPRAGFFLHVGRPRLRDLMASDATDSARHFPDSRFQRMPVAAAAKETARPWRLRASKSRTHIRLVIGAGVAWNWHCVPEWVQGSVCRGLAYPLRQGVRKQNAAGGEPQPPDCGEFLAPRLVTHTKCNKSCPKSAFLGLVQGIGYNPTIYGSWATRG